YEKKPRTPRSLSRRPRSMRGEPSPGALLAQTEFFNQGAVRVRVAALEVVEQLATAADHAQQTTARMVVLGMRLEVAGELVDAGRQQSDLDLGGSGIALGALEFRDDLGFDDICN